MPRRMITIVIGCLFRSFSLIPRALAMKLGVLLGNVWFALDKKHRQIAINNMHHAFGQEMGAGNIRRLARRVFQNLGKIIFEIGWSMVLRPRDFPKYFRVTGLNHYKHAFLKNKGVLVLTAHMGNWELWPVIHSMAGCPLNIVYRPLDFKPMDDFLCKLRTRYGGALIVTANSMRKILGRLRKKEAVFLLMDQNVDWYNGVFVAFFGRRACTNKGMALIALKTEAPVVPAFLVREGSGYYAEFGPEIPLIDTGDKTRDVADNTERYNQVVEAFVRRYPDQWFWVHQRWKTRAWHPWPRLQ